MDFITAAKSLCPEEIRSDEPLKGRTTAGLGGRAAYFAEVKSLYSLNVLTDFARQKKLPLRIIGHGSNILVSDKGFKGLVVSVAKLTEMFLKKDGVHAACGVPLSALYRFALKNKLSGAEELADIPGTVGGAVKMNAGAFGKSISDNLVFAETLYKGKVLRRDKSDLRFGYRKSGIRKGETVLSATFSFLPSSVNEIEKRKRECSEKRRLSQPAGRGFGSVFRNPDCGKNKKLYAAELIDGAGLKGYSVGGASVSFKHANFFVLEQNATATDVYNLIGYIKTRVKDEFGITLKEEVEYVGEF